jgi:signal transduction histidine kinase/ABC-type multidrug transport system ATPase subunit
MLRLAGVTARFGAVDALVAVDLEVRPGEIVGLVGENGAGKSTVVQCAAGIRRPDVGRVEVGGAPAGRGRLHPGTAVVWQDLGLCADLDVVANVFLGAEAGRWLLAETAMHVATRKVLSRLGADAIDVRRPVGALPRAQQQLVAIARALAASPRLLILDEATAALEPSAVTRTIEVLRDLRDRGIAILVATHDLDDVLGLADRLVVLRGGRVVAELAAHDAHRDDVLALMSGIEMGAMARHQLTRLQSLVDQLSGVATPTSLAMIVSAMAAAMDQDLLCLHLLDDDRPGPRLRRAAAVGLPPVLLAATADLPVGPEGGAAGIAAATGELAVLPDLTDAEGPLGTAAAAAGIRSMWAAPIVGRTGVLGTVSGFAPTVGGLRSDRRDLVAVYAAQAAGAIEREQLLAEVTRRNAVLESLRGILERLAGPERFEAAMRTALMALCRGLRADGVALHVETDGAVTRRAEVTLALDTSPPEVAPELLRAVIHAAEDGARELAPDVAAAPVRLPDGPGVLVAWWPRAADLGPDRLELIDDACRSLVLAFEREALEVSQREAAGLRQSQALQRELLSRLSHELRTPLTAVHGYASTLRQPDLEWDDASVDRFLAAIATESGRMERLVGDLLDSSAIESGLLQLQRDWCDLPLVLDAARACLADPARVRVTEDADVEPVWGDHDRLEQVFVNLFENAVRHGGDGEVTVTVAAADGTVTVTVADQGPGVPADVADRIFEPRYRGTTDHPGAGLGLSIARGIVDAHGGSLTLVPTPRGACFEVSLPAEPPPDDPAPVAETGHG